MIAEKTLIRMAGKVRIEIRSGPERNKLHNNKRRELGTRLLLKGSIFLFYFTAMVKKRRRKIGIRIL